MDVFYKIDNPVISPPNNFIITFLDGDGNIVAGPITITDNDFHSVDLDPGDYTMHVEYRVFEDGDICDTQDITIHVPEVAPVLCECNDNITVSASRNCDKTYSLIISADGDDNECGYRIIYGLMPVNPNGFLPSITTSSLTGQYPITLLSGLFGSQQLFVRIFSLCCGGDMIQCYEQIIDISTCDCSLPSFNVSAHQVYLDNFTIQYDFTLDLIGASFPGGSFVSVYIDEYMINQTVNTVFIQNMSATGTINFSRTYTVNNPPDHVIVRVNSSQCGETSKEISKRAGNLN